MQRVVGLTASLPEAIVYQRTGDTVVAQKIAWRPWLLSAQQVALPNSQETRVSGDGHCWLYTFPTADDFYEARSLLRDAEINTIALPSFERQFLIQSGITFFKEMVFEDAVRMQIDIETNALSPHNPSSRCLMVAVSDNRGFQEAVSGDEPAIFE
ncbi:MAG: hypothetical protein WCL39_14115, partial [Armatimonadota bacterium]